MLFALVIFFVSVFAGGVASIAGFGIGSLITPVLSISIGAKLAVAIVSVPHLLATSIRFYFLRAYLDKRHFWGFGLMSIVGGLCGALLHTKFSTPALSLCFGAILLFSGFMGASGLSEKLRFSGVFAWIAGAISGFLGGLVGNQGGIRSAALMGVKISKEAFVATATAIGLAVDLARMPVYFWYEYDGIFQNIEWIVLSCLGAVLGTFLGMRILKKIPERAFRRVVSAFIFILGAWMLYEGQR